MFDPEDFKNEIFSLNEDHFEKAALEVFEYQFLNNAIYQNYCQTLRKSPENVNRLTEIPFLPIEFFKHHEIKTGSWHHEKVFFSSGTTGSSRSQHLVRDLAFYHKNCQMYFESNFGMLSELELLALLPSYQSQGNSSLISMVDHLMAKAKSGEYFLDDYNHLYEKLENSEHKQILIGVSYALLDFIEQVNPKLGNQLIVIETGGMKGRRHEMIRSELHHLLKDGFRVSEISSEYGMTELMSQAYSQGDRFISPKWMKILIRETTDPFEFLENQRTGGINIIDLANIDTCCFIETQDLGRIYQNGTFEVLGRFDNSDIRGCNLMVS